MYAYAYVFIRHIAFRLLASSRICAALRLYSRYIVMAQPKQISNKNEVVNNNKEINRKRNTRQRQAKRVRI